MSPVAPLDQISIPIPRCQIPRSLQKVQPSGNDEAENVSAAVSAGQSAPDAADAAVARQCAGPADHARASVAPVGVADEWANTATITSVAERHVVAAVVQADPSAKAHCFHAHFLHRLRLNRHTFGLGCHGYPRVETPIEVE